MRNSFHVVSGLIFALVAVLQVVRAVNQWPVHIHTYDIPVTASWIAAVVAGLLCVWAFASQGKELTRV
jgi:hypothetical protein